MEEQPEFDDRIIGPNDNKGVSMHEGDEVEIKYRNPLGNWVRHKFDVESSEHKQMLKLIEEDGNDETDSGRAVAYFDRSKEVIFKWIPDVIKGDEGQKFGRILTGLGAAAAAGAAAAYIVVRRRKK